MKLNYKKFGEGIPVVILHGLFGSLDNWQTFGKQLAERFEVYLVDLRNHGHSPHSDDFSYELMAEDLKTFFDENFLRGVYLVGHSMGGKAAMFLTQQQASLIDKLVIVDIGPKYYEPHHSQIINGLQSVDLDIVKTRGAVDEILSQKVPELGVRQFLLKNLYWKEKGQLAWRMNLEVIAQKIEEVGKKLPDGEINVETLFIKGGKSNYIKENDEDLILSQFTKAQIENIENAGHWVHAEAPQEMQKTLVDFFSL